MKQYKYKIKVFQYNSLNTIKLRKKFLLLIFKKLSISNENWKFTQTKNSKWKLSKNDPPYWQS